MSYEHIKSPNQRGVLFPSHCPEERTGAAAVRLSAGFTLVEVMVSMTVLAIMLGIIAQIIGATQRSWRSASSRLTQFREARIAFDTVTRNLRQATLNSYRDFHYAASNSNVPGSSSPSEAPDGFRRISELAFITGKARTLVTTGGDHIKGYSGHAVFFQAPLGVTDPATSPKTGGRPRYENLKNLLSARGYFVGYGDDEEYLPAGLKTRLETRNRFRLMEYQPPAEQNTIYEGDNSWYAIKPEYLRPVSDRIIGLIISPRLATGDSPVSINGSSIDPISIARDYSFDSRLLSAGASGARQGSQHQLPPVVRVAMIALDDASAEKMALEAGEGTPDPMGEAQATFDNAARYAEDMESLKTYLASKKYNYRVFEATIVIPASRWTL